MQRVRQAHWRSDYDWNLIGEDYTMGEMQSVRAFVAIELTASIKALLSIVQQELREALAGAERAVRWVNADSIHLTIQFLGDVPVEQLDGVKLAVSRATVGVPAFNMDLSGLGVFPNLRRPRVIWVGLEGEQKAREALRTLHAQTAEQLAPLGYAPDKSFRPHLTLGRVRETAMRQELADISALMASPQDQPMFDTTLDIHEVSLMKSDLQPSGTIYTRLAAVPLAREM